MADVQIGYAISSEEHLPNPDSYAWDLVIRFPVRAPDDRITHIGGFDVDITARKARELELVRSEERLRLAQEG